MKTQIPEELERGRRQDRHKSNVGEWPGAYTVKGHGRRLNLIIGVGWGWEHVSVSITTSPHSIPTWQEMCWVKDLCWSEDECVVQFHPPKKDYVNDHPGVLHLWRSLSAEIPMPSKLMV